MNRRIGYGLRVLGLLVMFLFAGIYSYAGDKDFPERPSPPKLVNDLAHMMSPTEQADLEEKLRLFERETSNEITIVTIVSLGDYDVADYAVKLGKAWGVGKGGKNNGVVILASLQEHKISIQSGKGLEGALTDLMSGRIIRNEMVPPFKQGFYFQGFSKGVDAVIAVTKGEYKADKAEKGRHMPFTGIIIAVIFLIFVLRMFRGGGGGGRGGGGIGNFASGMLLGSMLGGRGGDSGGWGGGGDSGGFGGFGGGDFGGGGASGSW